MAIGNQKWVPFGTGDVRVAPERLPNTCDLNGKKATNTEGYETN